MNRCILALFFVFSACTCMHAQQMILSPTVLAPAGGHDQSANYTLSWRLGEVAVTTLNGNNLILTQGFQQSFGLDVGIRERVTDLGIRVYPNPVKNELFIRFGSEKESDYLLEIEDVTGRIMLQQSYSRVEPGDILRINTSAFSSGVYFLRIISSDLNRMQVTGIRKL